VKLFVFISQVEYDPSRPPRQQPVNDLGFHLLGTDVHHPY
jgi:hypothetical protein